MTYLVTYECRTGSTIFVGEFKLESKEELKISDKSVIDQAQLDSIKFHTFGIAGISIIAISQYQK